MPSCLFPDELSILPPARSCAQGTGHSAGLGRDVPGTHSPAHGHLVVGVQGRGFALDQLSQELQGKTKSPSEISTVAVQPAATALTGTGVQGKLSPTGQGN